MKFNYLMRDAERLCEAGCAFRIEKVLAFVRAHEEYMCLVIDAWRRHGHRIREREMFNVYVDFMKGDDERHVEASKNVVHIVALKPPWMMRECDPNKKLRACGMRHEWDAALFYVNETDDALRLMTSRRNTQMGVPIPESGQWGALMKGPET